MLLRVENPASYNNIPRRFTEEGDKIKLASSLEEEIRNSNQLQRGVTQNYMNYK